MKQKMTSNRIQWLSTAAIFFALSMALFVGCQSAPDASKIGVFASTDRGLLELTGYGNQVGMNQYHVSSVDSLPQTSGVHSFYINIPDSRISEAKLYWKATIGPTFDDSDQPPLSTSIVTIKGNLYRLDCSSLSDKKNGFAILKISMPLGVPDRLYVVHVAP